MMSPTMLTYINEESATLVRILREYRQTLADISDFAHHRKIERITILATGSSLNAAYCARYFSKSSR